MRFAPSPTGTLHLGNVRTALFNWLFSRRHGGIFILRVEDTDLEREVAGAEAALQEDLRWLGLTWDEGPDIGGPYGPYRQSERLEDYRRSSSGLIARGRAYPCFCSAERLEEDRKLQAAAGQAPRYLGHCAAIPPGDSSARLGAGEPAAVRLRVPAWPAVRDALRGEVDFSARVASDPVLMRRDGRPTYNFAVVVDDLAMRVTHVLRGDDHISNTPVQVAVIEALGGTPPVYAHLPTVLGADGSPLSKRHGAVSVAEFRRQGYPAEALGAALWRLGWTPPEDLPIDIEAAARAFDLERVSHSPSTFDPGRLDHLGAAVISALEPAARAGRALPFLEQLLGEAADPAKWSAAALDWLGRALGLWSHQAHRFSDFNDLARGLFDFSGVLASAPPALRADLAATESLEVARAFAAECIAAGRLSSAEEFQSAARASGKNTETKGRALFHPIRLAVTGEESGPELQKIAPLIDEGARLKLPSRGGSPLKIFSVEDRVRLALGWAEGARAS